jgi:type IV pilus assembly protein PilF
MKMKDLREIDIKMSELKKELKRVRLNRLTNLSYLATLLRMDLKKQVFFKSIALLCCMLGCSAINQKHTKAQKEEAQYRYQLAYGSFFESKNGDAALQDILLSLQAVEDDPQTHFLAGLIFSGRGRHLDAISHYQRAIELKKDFYEAQNNLGTIYLTLEQWDQAIPVFEALSQNVLYPSPGLSHNNLGWAYYKKKNFQKAKAHFLSAIQLSPTLCPSYNNMGLTCMALEEFEPAVRYLKQAIDRCPQYAEPYHHIGQIFFTLKRFDLSKKAFDKCSKLASESPIGLKCDQKLSLMSNGYQDETSE